FHVTGVQTCALPIFAWQRTGEMTAMGYGWEVIPVKTRTMYYKEHSTGNFTAGITMIPSDELAVAVVSNIAGDFNTESVRNGIIQIGRASCRERVWR